MKAIFSILTLVVLTFAFSTAFADDIPYTMNTKDAGTEIYENAFGRDAYGSNPCVQDFSASGVPIEKAGVDVGTALYDEAFLNDLPVIEHGSAIGSEAGGGCPEPAIKEDEHGKILDNLMGAPGGSDLP